MRLGFDRHCAEIVTQTALLADHLDGADVSVPVPTCPGWNVSQLARHVDGGQRWADAIVATRASEPPSDAALRDLSGATNDDPVVLAASLIQAATALRATLTEAGPDAQIWCPVADGGSAFYARRFAHEVALHRADAALALGVDYTLEPDVAADAVDEWMELGCLPFHFEVHPWMRELLAPGRTIGLHATDTDAHWLLDLTGDVIAWRRADEPATAEIRAPVTDLLLAVYRRRPAADLEIAGDATLVDFWLERVAFG
ncbi:MAG TPA: maleylpyruvate isomerase family mycothiol-dependent enzyme [Mycobacterium sp.]